MSANKNVRPTSRGTGEEPTMSNSVFDSMWQIGERVTRAPHVLLCLDFDGTLTPLIDHPEQVYLSAQMQRVLRSLAHHARMTVALISGRQRADVQARVAIPGLIYAGNHGLEISGDGFIFVEPQALEYQESLQALAAEVMGRLEAIEGAFVEDKGLTLSVHYRRADATQFEEVRRSVHAALARASHPFVLTAGDMVYEICPRVYWNKGSAALWIQDRLAHPEILPIFVGDDATDEDAFTALRDGVTVKVGMYGDTAAQYDLDGPADVRRFLEWLAELMRQTATPRLDNLASGGT
jgi:trehalose 6-phosphate phosphatase